MSARKGSLYFVNIRELKQQRRRRLRKRDLKSEFALLQTLSRLFHLVYFVKCWQMFLELNSKGLYQSSGKEKESCCLVFPSSTKREIRHFHVVVVQWRQRNVQKSVMHVQSCFLANLNLLLFCRSRCLRCSLKWTLRGYAIVSVLPGCPNYRTYEKAFAVSVRFSKYGKIFSHRYYADTQCP